MPTLRSLRRRWPDVSRRPTTSLSQGSRMHDVTAPIRSASSHRRVVAVLTASVVAIGSLYGCDGDRLHAPMAPRVSRPAVPRATYVKESGVVELPVQANSSGPLYGGAEWVVSNVII